MTNNNHTFANTNLVAVPTELMLDPRLTLDAKGAAVCIYEDDTHLQNFNFAKLAQQIGITKAFLFSPSSLQPLTMVFITP